MSCAVAGCKLPPKTGGLCVGHYQRKLRGTPLEAPWRVTKKPKERALRPRKLCSIEGCGKPHKSHGLCHTHNARREKGQPLDAPLRNAPKKCGVEGCTNEYSAKGYCLPHYGRARHASGDIRAPFRAKAPNGAGWVGRYGYRYGSFDGARKLEHRHLMEEALGRQLLKHETVHHKNGARADNRIKKGHELGGCPSTCCNLELWSTYQPKGQRVSDKIDYAIKILQTYYPNNPRIIVEGSPL